MPESRAWRLERLDAGVATSVSATLTSDNPVAFTVVAGRRTTVPLRFHVDTGEVDMMQGYDITIEVEEVTPPPGYQAIDAPSQRSRLIFDAGHGALSGVNRLDQEIERFTLSGDRWTTTSPVVVPQLTDVAMTRPP